MTSPVNWALLGLLLARPGYGYQLMKRFEETYGDVLVLGSESHVYTALNELSRRGLIEEIAEERAAQAGTQRQPKIRYRATVAGADAYRERMFEQAGADRRQAQLFVRQLAAMEHEPDTALEILARYEQACLSEARRRRRGGSSTGCSRTRAAWRWRAGFPGSSTRAASSAPRRRRSPRPDGSADGVLS